MNWIQQVLEATEEAESPRAFTYWAALAAISAVVRKNVWWDKFYYKLYPNIYVLLIAKSGMRKAFPVSMAKRLVRLTKVTRVIAGRNSIQAILQDLSKGFTQLNGEMITDGHGFLCAGEFSSFIIRDQDALTILTDLYDTHDHEPEWKNLLKSGNEIIANPCITMLGASNQTHLRDKITEVDIDGGFIGRTLMIVSEKKHKVNSLMYRPEITPDWDELAKHLKDISKLHGEFFVEPEARDYFDHWYRDYCGTDHDDRTGSTNRVHENILKVSMLIALSQRVDLVIKVDDVKSAVTSCLSFMSNVNRTIMSGNKSDLAEPTKLVLGELISNPDHCLPRTKVLQRLWGDVDAFNLDRIAETLTQAGLITSSGQGQGMVYRLSQAALDKYAAFKEGIN